MPKDLAKQYGCQTSKLIAAILYQVAYVTISSFGVRSLLIKSDQGPHKFSKNLCDSAIFDFTYVAFSMATFSMYQS